MKRSGQVHCCRSPGSIEYGVSDIDGKTAETAHARDDLELILNQPFVLRLTGQSQVRTDVPEAIDHQRRSRLSFRQFRPGEHNRVVHSALP